MLPSIAVLKNARTYSSPPLLFLSFHLFLLSSLPSFSYPRDKFESALETREKTCIFLFSGPEQFFNGAPMFSPLPFTMIFRREFDRFHCVDRSRCSKMLGIYYWIAICFPKEIDAFLFSGPEQFFNGAPMFSPLPFTMIFRREFDRFHCVDRSRCSKMLGIYYWTLVHTDSTRSTIPRPPPRRSASSSEPIRPPAISFIYSSSQLFSFSFYWFSSFPSFFSFLSLSLFLFPLSLP